MEKRKSVNIRTKRNSKVNKMNQNEISKEQESCKKVDMAHHMISGVGLILTSAIGLFINPVAFLPAIGIAYLWYRGREPCIPDWQYEWCME